MKPHYHNISVFILLIFISCSKSDYDYSADQNTSQGSAGSLARFAISDNYMYVVDVQRLKVFDITDESKPVSVSDQYVDFGIETIFCYEDKLFLGTQSGVYIYSISNPASPAYISIYTHIVSCDPVVAQGNYAYSTLRTGNSCSRGFNELDVIDISNPYNPSLVKDIPMNNPKGLGISGSLLFVCDDHLKVFDINNPANPLLVKSVNIEAFDVIPIDTLLLLATDQGLAEYVIGENYSIEYLSTLYTK